MLCSFCGVSFKSLVVLKEHLQKHEKNNGIACKNCDKLCKTKRVLYDHMRQAHGDQIQCECCNKSFSCLSNLRHHLRKREINKCKLCEKEFTNKHSFKQHMQNHTVICTSIKCEKCPKEFPTITSLASHVSLVYRGPLKCTQCDKEYKTRNSLKRHDLRSHTVMTKSGNNYELNHISCI